jgi:hypothetical protein
MKFKTTKKAIRNGYYRIISVGYCNLQSLLNYEYPTAYSTRIEGWACDYYDIDGVCICTGYSPIGSQNTWADYELCREYENKAKEVNTREEKTMLLKEFIEKAIVKN